MTRRASYRTRILPPRTTPFDRSPRRWRATAAVVAAAVGLVIVTTVSGRTPPPALATVATVGAATPAARPPASRAVPSPSPIRRSPLGDLGAGAATGTVRTEVFGATWTCGYFAVGAASGSTLELRIDELGGRITPAAGDVVALFCADDGSGEIVHQEIVIFDPARPFGSLDG